MSVVNYVKCDHCSEVYGSTTNLPYPWVTVTSNSIDDLSDISHFCCTECVVSYFDTCKQDMEDSYIEVRLSDFMNDVRRSW